VEGADIGGSLPEESHGDPVLPSFLYRQSGTHSVGYASTHNTAAAKMQTGFKEVHMASLTLAEAGFLAKDLGHHLVEVNPFGNQVSVRPVSAGDGVIGA
jgi:hypothetical protein